MKPICVDLFCGLGGWSEGFLEEGYDVIGFDVERHMYGVNGPTGHYATTEYTQYPGQLVIQDVLTLHGSQFRNAACIVASPPCQEFSYMAMPWQRAKQIAAALRGRGEFPKDYEGSRTVAQLTALFDACFRIQREACEAAGRYIPMVVENVKGAQPWVGKAKAHFGSFYLFGDVESIGGAVVAGAVRFGMPLARADGKPKGFGGTWFHNAELGTTNPNRSRTTENPAIKNGGGSWFNIGSPGQTNVGQNPDGRKVPGFNFHEHENGQPGRSFQSAAVADGLKRPGRSISQGFNNWPKDEDGAYIMPDGSRVGGSGTKQPGLSGAAWFDHGAAHLSSRSSARKAASAQIAKIPTALARYIARSFHPAAMEAAKK